MIVRLFRRAKRFYLDLRIGSKLLLMYLVAFLIPFVLLSLLSYRVLRDELMAKTRMDLDTAVSGTTQHIEDKLEDFASVASMVLLDHNLQLYLQTEYRDSNYIEAYRYIEDRFDTVQLLNPGIVALTLYVSNPTLPSDTVNVLYIDRDARREAWYGPLTEQDGKRLVYLPTTWTRPRASITQGDEEIPAFTLIMQMDYTLSRYGDSILRMAVREEEIASFLEDYGDEGEVLVLDPSGTVLASGGGEDVGLPLVDLYALSGDLSGLDGWLEGTRADGRSVVVRHRSLANGWRVVGLLSSDNLTRKVNERLLELTFLYGIFLLVAIGLFYLTSRVWNRRIETLTHHMKKLEQGNFDIPSTDGGKDEFSQMLGSFASMSRKLQELIDEVYVKEIAKKKAELDNLQSLINPHFLYNTLSSISLLAKRNDDRDVMYMVNQLSRFYRSALGKGRSLIAIAEEIELTRSYLAIQQVRLPDQLQARFDLDESLLSYKTVKVILQPFVENSIHHALRDQQSVLSIDIRLYAEGDDICFTIADDGSGFDVSRPASGNAPAEELSSGFGIRNVDERIRTTFGAPYGVAIESGIGIGTTVRIRIPRVE